MAKLTKFQRSQNAHRSISQKYRGALIFDGDYTEKVKSIYHNNVYHEQDLKRRLLTKREKRELFNWSRKTAK